MATVASGKTLLMCHIRTPAPVVIHRHAGAPRRERRRRKLTWKGSFVRNVPYIYPARDQRKGRKLRGGQDG